MNAQRLRATGLRASADLPIRLLIVDDSQVARAVLSRMMGGHDDIDVVATAGSAEEALRILPSVEVDIVLLDIEMPGASGLEALPRILEQGAGAKVLIVSSMAEKGADAAVRALALGATDTLPKPGLGNFAGRFAETLASCVRRIGRAHRDQRSSLERTLQTLQLRDSSATRMACLAIGASTGGLHALNAFLNALPDRLGVPLLVTQHLPPVFMPFFARQLEDSTGRRAVVAEEGQALRADVIHVAPGHGHLTLERRGASVRVRLDDTPAPCGCLPAVDRMLDSLAAAYGAEGVGVILTGMGRDGTSGGRALVDAGGTLFAQDRDSCAIWGMPRSAAEAGLASAVAPPADLAARVAALAEAPQWN